MSLDKLKFTCYDNYEPIGVLFEGSGGGYVSIKYDSDEDDCGGEILNLPYSVVENIVKTKKKFDTKC